MTVLVLDQTLVMVSASHGVVLASSAQPPHRSTTSSPSSMTATEAPQSAPEARLAANWSAMAWKRGSQVPCTVGSFPIPVTLHRTGDSLRAAVEVSPQPAFRHRRNSE